MKDKLRAAFDQVHMDPECTAGIQSLLNNPPKGAGIYTATPFRENRGSRLTAAAAMVCMLAAVLFLGSTLLGGQTPKEMTTPTDPAASTETTQASLSQEKVDSNPRVFGHTNADFLSPEGDRLYFVADGQHTDITDLISYDEPYTYVYTDDMGIIHYLAVGGSYTPGSNSLDGVCYSYWYRDAANATGRYSGWLGGNAAGHWSNADNDYFGWFLKAEALFDTPWSP